MGKINFTFLIYFTSLGLIYGQNSTEINFINDYIIPLKTHQTNIIKERKETLKDSFYLMFLECQIDNIEHQIVKDSNFEKFESFTKTNSFQNIIYHLNKGDYILTNKRFSDSEAIIEYEHAINIAKRINNKYLACEALRRICSYLFKTQKNILELEKTIERYKEYAYDDFEEYSLAFFILGHQMQKANRDSLKIDSYPFYKLISKAKKTNIKFAIGEAYQLTGAYFMVFNNNIDSTYHYYSLAQNKYDNYNTVTSRIKSIGLEINKSILLQQKGKYKESLDKLDSIKNFKIPNRNLREQLSIYQFLKNAYFNLNDYKSAYELQSIEKGIEDSLGIIKHKIAIADIQTLYKTKEKDEENFQLIKSKQNLWIGSIMVLLLGSTIALLIQKNTKRKQLFAEQEKALETQKLTNVLKDQELTAIDAMIEGQEKERQRIANDLHDDLGGLMANVKMHFNALKDKQSEDLFTKTDKLLDEAYQKVRTVAHAKNSGVIAKQGLLKAVQNMAAKISTNNKININVIDHDLESRFENSLELTLFRIIQELITNVIKHAEATQTTIHITNHEDSLNIMVEDNGKGFNTKNITKASGMGIHSIDKRIENLGGTVTIESEINKGTTVIIDIPS